MIPIAKPQLGEEEKRAVIEVLDSGMLAQGSKVALFEKAFAQFIGVKHAIATSNGTTALHAALLAHGITKEDEVITTSFSFIATTNAILMAGATPVFVDIEQDSFNIDPCLIEAAITSKTKAILPVHLFGRSASMDKIMAIAQKHNLIVIEDACQAHGAQFQGKKAGSFGTGCFSFYPTKNMTTGEGGMITTNDDNVAANLRRLISHGSEKRYYHLHLGYNYRMTDIAAAIGIEQLKKLPFFNKKRQENASYLNQKLGGKGDGEEDRNRKVGKKVMSVIIPEAVEGHVFHQYTIRVKEREKIMGHLSHKDIGTAIFYPLPIHQQQAYSQFNHLHFPVTEKVAGEVLSLPIHPGLTRSNLDAIAAAVSEVSDISVVSNISAAINIQKGASP